MPDKSLGTWQSRRHLNPRALVTHKMGFASPNGKVVSLKKYKHWWKKYTRHEVALREHGMKHHFPPLDKFLGLQKSRQTSVLDKNLPSLQRFLPHHFCFQRPVKGFPILRQNLLLDDCVELLSICTKIDETINETALLHQWGVEKTKRLNLTIPGLCSTYILLHLPIYTANVEAKHVYSHAR